MKNSIPIILVFFSTQVFSQTGTVYEIEKLSAPEGFMYQTTPQSIFRSLQADIEKSSRLPDSLVSFGEHPFLTGILTAYKEHRPFVISPDIIWLLISQGFARHISNNAEEFRKDLVNFENKKELTVLVTDIEIGNPASNWESVFPQFINQINDYTGKELSGMLVSDFSTTTQTSKIVSQITVMETVKEYFTYKVLMFSCGIPKITIEGTKEDWEKILVKIKYISKFNLQWWTSELEPIIEQIIETKKGHFDNSFWMNMVKAHTEKKYGSPTTIDGWIIKFFPYTKEGKRTNLQPISKINSLASEMVKVPFIAEDVPHHKSYKMEFWAGFIGLSQNKQDYTLKPEIGWAVNNKTSFDPAKSVFRNQKKMDDLSITNVVIIPDDIYSIEQINFLHISFLKDILIPDKLAKIKIATLELNGRISTEEEIKIARLFPNTKLIINGQQK